MPSPSSPPTSFTSNTFRDLWPSGGGVNNGSGGGVNVGDEGVNVGGEGGEEVNVGGGGVNVSGEGVIAGIPWWAGSV